MMDVMQIAMVRKSIEQVRNGAPAASGINRGQLPAVLAVRSLMCNSCAVQGPPKAVSPSELSLVLPMTQVKAMMAQLKPAAQWAQSNLAVYQHKDAELKGQAAAKRRELEALRGAALKAALEAGSGGGAVPPIEKLSLI
jgi:hypothetical protein